MQPKTILIIGYTWPEPASTAAGNRMLQLLQFFLEQGYRIVFASTANETELSFDLEGLGIEKAPILLNDSSFDSFLTNLKPEIVLFDRFLTEEQFGWRVAEFTPEAIRILDTEDLHSLRNTRENLLKKGIEFKQEAWLQNTMTKREIASIYRCDLSLIISSFEMDLLQNGVKINPSLLLHLPFMLSEIGQEEINNWPSYTKRKDFVCIGNGRHAPNIDALLWLKEEIWPKIAERLPDVTLHVFGSYLPQHILNLHHPKGRFLVKGRADNVEEVMNNARLNLAPLRFGAGLKGKLILAMQSGTPSITTSIGAEGMHEALPWSGKVTDNVEDFAKAAIELYKDEIIWKRAQKNGADIINKIYKKEKLGSDLALKIKNLRLQLKEHRSENFIGSLLNLQAMQATKYLSKWIELKNTKD